LDWCCYKKKGKQVGTIDQYGLVCVLEGKGGPTLFFLCGGEEREYLGCQDLEQRASAFAFYSEMSFLNMRYTLSRRNDICCKRGVCFSQKDANIGSGITWKRGLNQTSCDGKHEFL